MLLEQVYITERDRLCVGGVKWSSPALNYQLSQFQQERAKEKQRRLEQEKASNEELEGKEEQRDLGSEVSLLIATKLSDSWSLLHCFQSYLFVFKISLSKHGVTKHMNLCMC